jgi:glycosyltransferase involved in cell wall biosynthesis
VKFAYLSFPHLGGTFTVYRHLRAGLAAAGIDVRWLGAGILAHRALVDPRWTGERAYGRVVGEPGDDERRLCARLVRAINVEFDGVFVNVLTSRPEMDSVRYLPRDLTRIMIVHNITPGTYGPARAVRDNVHATVGVSPRISRDLIRKYGFNSERTFTILHGVDATFPATLSPSPCAGRVRLIYLGRVEDAAKGVFSLPKIMASLPSEIFLTIAGDGPDLPALRKRCARLADRITFLGAVDPDRVSTLLAEHDMLLMPSRFEGFGLTLIEAMAAGCVPVATRIAGVTHAIVGNGRDGVLFPPGDTQAAARAILSLARSPTHLRAMSIAAQDAVRRRFNITAMAEGYLRVIDAARSLPLNVAPPLDLEVWKSPQGMGPGLRRLVPLPVKNLLRTMRERIAV